MAGKSSGRVPCGFMNLTEFSESVMAHVPSSGDDLAQWYKYTQRDARRKPQWAELSRLRSAVTDLFTATEGYLLCQKDVERAVTVGWRTKQIEAEHRGVQPDPDAVETIAYRIRMIMTQSRNANLGMWQIPVKYDK